ncbi:MAG: UDP-N-acetylmuramoyl-L-alanine--D-glutamate ligase [Rubrivivax sp.]
MLVLGLGDSGLAMARWCVRHGADVTVWDSRDDPPQAAALQTGVPAARRLQGALSAESLAGFKLILKSPGLSPTDARIAPLLQPARATGIAVLSELDLFVRALADLKAESGYAPQLLAVTGTNGKTTTTAMVERLLAHAGKRVVAAGNIGPTLLDTLSRAIDGGDPLPEVWVLELSSFQLAGGLGDGIAASGPAGGGFEPTAAALLNLSQDHLDWHGSNNAYAATKSRIFGSSGVMVLNRDDAAVLALASAALVPTPTPALAADKGKGRGSKTKAAPARSVVRFGLDSPRLPGDFGLVTENGMAWLVRALPDEDAAVRRAADGPAQIHLQRLMPADALRVRGRHNSANALAALALASAAGCAIGPMLHALQTYEGEPHRLQPVAQIDGVDAYDDSKATNVGATVAALQGLGSEREPAKLIVILGGDGKGQDFAPLREPLRRHARAVATIGRDAGLIESVIGAAIDPTADGASPLQRHADMDAAVAWCFDQARPGDAVLLSPACASLDMYRSYAHRGEVFAAAVLQLANDRGQA